MKEKNFNLKLPLHIPSSASLLPSMDYHHPRSEVVSEEHQQQPLTIFYNGQVCTCSVNEFQARAILLHARREMEELKLQISPSGGSQPPSPTVLWPPQQQFCSPNSLSMKRSLEQFLQKRKHRIGHTSSSSTP